MERFGVYGNSVLSAHFSKKQNLLNKKKRAALAGPRYWGVDTSAPRTVKPTETPLGALEVGSGLHTRDLLGQASLIPDPVAPPPWEEVAGGGQHGVLWRVSPGQTGSKDSAGKRTRI